MNNGDSQISPKISEDRNGLHVNRPISCMQANVCTIGNAGMKLPERTLVTPKKKKKKKVEAKPVFFLSSEDSLRNTEMSSQAVLKICYF